MKRFIQDESRTQSTLLPECQDGVTAPDDVQRDLVEECAQAARHAGKTA